MGCPFPQPVPGPVLATPAWGHRTPGTAPSAACHVCARPSVRAAGAARAAPPHLVPGAALAPVSPQPRGPDTVNSLARPALSHLGYYRHHPHPPTMAQERKLRLGGHMEKWHSREGTGLDPTLGCKTTSQSSSHAAPPSPEPLDLAPRGREVLWGAPGSWVTKLHRFPKQGPRAQPGSLVFLRAALPDKGLSGHQRKGLVGL